jgi:hypothetical protein
MTTITTNRGSGGENRRVREGQARRAGLPMLLLVSASLMLAACGGSSGGSSTASNQAVGGGGSDASHAAAPNRLVRFAQCMRANGVPNFPDPVNGHLMLQAGPGNLNPSSPAFQTASQACKSLAPSGTVGSAQSAQGSGKEVLFAQCMRSHGVPNFPDPKELPGGNFQLTLPNGVDPSAPQFQAAQQACQSLSPLPAP